MKKLLFLLPALSLALLAGCNDQEPAPSALGAGATGGQLEPPEEGKGIQLRMRTVIAPGVETERCQLVQLPPGGLNINRQEVRFSEGSHHVLLYSTSYKEMPTKDLHGKAVAPGEVIDCPDGAPADFAVDRVIGGSQTASGPNLLGGLPPDVALKVPGGAIVLINTHYLNPTGADLDVEVRFNLHTIPDAQVKHEAGVIFFYNPFIHVPAHGKHSARMSCPVPQDITLLNLQSHMHKRGVGYVADLVSSDAGSRETLYTNTKWEDVPVQEWAGGKAIQAGSWLDYRCDFANKEDRAIIQGLKTTDEMCMLIGTYYPKNESFEVCEAASGAFAGVWHGAGSATCGQTLGCVVSKGNTTEGFFECIVNSCEKAGPQVSTLLKCQLSSGHGKCTKECQGDGGGCFDCLAEACKDSIDACTAASCD
jgi:hypothetical protein